MGKSRTESQEGFKLHKELQRDVEVYWTRLLGLHSATLVQVYPRPRWSKSSIEAYNQYQAPIYLLADQHCCYLCLCRMLVWCRSNFLMLWFSHCVTKETEFSHPPLVATPLPETNWKPEVRFILECMNPMSDCRLCGGFVSTVMLPCSTLNTISGYSPNLLAQVFLCTQLYY